MGEIEPLAPADKDSRFSPELVTALLDAGVQRPAVLAECDREEELLLGGVAQQERALRLALEQMLRLVAVHLAPVEAAVRDLLQIGHQTMHKVDLRVHCQGAGTDARDPGHGCHHWAGLGRRQRRKGSGFSDDSDPAAAGRLHDEARRRYPDDHLLVAMARRIGNSHRVALALALQSVLRGAATGGTQRGRRGASIRCPGFPRHGRHRRHTGGG